MGRKRKKATGKEKFKTILETIKTKCYAICNKLNAAFHYWYSAVCMEYKQNPFLKELDDQNEVERIRFNIM